VFTHDSIGVGEDGPTHQPIEQLLSLRAIPGLTVIRPADANETAEAWRLALRANGPTALVLTRQKLPTLDRTVCAPASEMAKGGYVLVRESRSPADVILIATGSEVSLAVSAARTLEEKGISTRVVNLACWELFGRQDAAYRDAVLPPAVTARISVEAGVTLGWSRYVGDRGASVGIDRFGASAPAKVLFEKLGVTAERVVATALGLIGRK
jgi:transketolase